MLSTCGTIQNRDNKKPLLKLKFYSSEEGLHFILVEKRELQ